MAITETFPGTSATLGGDLTWTEVLGTWSNASGKAALSAAVDASARAESDLGTADHYAQIVVEDLYLAGTTAYGGACVRFDASANTYYEGMLYRGSDKFYIRKRIAGTFTNLANTAATYTLPNTVKLTVVQAGGNANLELFQDGTSRLTVTGDTSGLTGTRAGISGLNGGTFSMDAFEAGTLGGGAGITGPLINFKHLGGGGALIGGRLVG